MHSPVVTVIATFQARPGQENELKAALTALVEPTRREAGCINYDLHQLPEDPARFLFHENWASQAHLDAHLQSAHLQALLPRVPQLAVAPPDIRIWSKIA
jgi:quinol monooxygenase YgiN